jgi:HEPN domain-containing protein
VKKKVASLLDLAETDLRHAADNLRSHPAHAAMSVQQAAEKMIKAALEVASVSYPATSHQLDLLVSLVPANNPFKGDFAPLARLTAVATKYRYPTARGDVPEDPPASETKADMDAVRLLLPEVRDWARAEK